MNEEKTTENIFERFLAGRENDILPDIDLLMEVGIHNNKWQAFTDEEKLALNDTLVQMENVNGGIRNSIHGLDSAKNESSKREHNPDMKPFQLNVEGLKVVHQMISQGRLDRIPQIANFIEEFTGKKVVGK